MPRNKRGGRKHKKNKNARDNTSYRKLELATGDLIYARIDRKLGGSKFLLECSDKKMRQGRIPGKFKRRKWFNKHDVILCDPNGYGKDVALICHLYTKEEIKVLTDLGKINFSSEPNTDLNSGMEDNIQFVDLVPKQERDYNISEL